jgi:hypothetical protein
MGKFSCSYSNNCAVLGNIKKKWHQAKRSIERRVTASGGSCWSKGVGGVKKQFAQRVVGEKLQMESKKSSLYRETAEPVVTDVLWG